ncbi:MAG: hypothetical protein AAFU71_14595 [Cyanobacteria bacterium J06632_22]
MKLHLQPTKDEAPPSVIARFRRARNIRTDVNVSLTITFSGQQAIDIPKGKRLGLTGGQTTFGIRRGQLKLALQNCTMPPDQISLGTAGIQGGSKQPSTDLFHVQNTSAEESPTWTFEANKAHRLIEGTLKEQLLGLLSVATSPYDISATFTVEGEDIQLDWGQLRGAQNIHRNKLAMIERGIVLRYLKPLLETAPLCEWRGSHD